MKARLLRILGTNVVLQAQHCSKTNLDRETTVGRVPRRLKLGPIRNSSAESDSTAERHARLDDRDAGTTNLREAA